MTAPSGANACKVISLVTSEWMKQLEDLMIETRLHYEILILCVIIGSALTRLLMR